MTPPWRLLSPRLDYVRPTGVDLYLEPELAARLALERGTRTPAEVTAELGPPSTERSIVEDLEAAAAMFGVDVRLRHAARPRRPSFPSDQAAERCVHPAEDDGRPASPPPPTPASSVPVRARPACNAPGSLGRHHLDRDPSRPTACPCGAVSHYPKELRP